MPPRFTLPYKLHANYTVKKTLKSTDRSHTFKRSPTIFNLLRNDKDKRTEEYKSGVYKIPLRNIDDNRTEVYVGATSRNFRERLIEHKSNISKGKFVTALAQRAYEKHVDIIWQDAKVIKSVHDRRDLQMREKLEIMKANETTNTINIRQAVDLSPAWKYAIKKSL